MKIGIVVAMQKELKLLLPLLHNAVEKNISGYTVTEGTIGDNTVALLQCGIGKVNAALSVDFLIRFMNPDIIINSGVAGGSDPSMHVLDIFIADEVTYHDVWCGSETNYGATAGMEARMKADDNFVGKAVAAVPCEKLKRGLICSGDKFITTPEEIKEIKSHFPDSLAVDMESGAVAQVCRRNNVPFGVIRVISDTPGEAENISQYEDFWTKAPEATFEVVRDILASL